MKRSFLRFSERSVEEQKSIIVAEHRLRYALEKEWHYLAVSSALLLAERWYGGTLAVVWHLLHARFRLFFQTHLHYKSILLNAWFWYATRRHWIVIRGYRRHWHTCTREDVVQREDGGGYSGVLDECLAEHMPRWIYRFSWFYLNIKENVVGDHHVQKDI